VAVDPVKYLQEVKSEVARVRWPTRKETLVTTGMVLSMAVMAAVFFFLVDWAIGQGVRALFGSNS
jgi:preprotein translocase subunit SecE